MKSSRILLGTLIAVVSAAPAHAQDSQVPQLSPGTAHKPASIGTATPQAAVPQTMPLTVPKGTSLQVALDRELRVKKVGQPVHARVMEPVYAFDRLVIPVGSEVTGEITKIADISTAKRTLAALDADLTPSREIEIAFQDLVLADGRHLPLRTNVSPGSGQVVSFITSPEKERKGVKGAAAKKTTEAKQRAHDEWNAAMSQLKTPGRVHRLERYGQAQLPVHPQYIAAGTLYFAELEDPLDFGSEVMTQQMATSLAGPVPEGCVVRARLMTPLSSATAKKGDNVEAVLSRPVFDGDRLILPQGTRLTGTVRRAEPAHHLKRNGQLRIAFMELVPPDGLEQKVQATLVGVQAGKEANVKLDSEGGAEATNSKSRYLSTTVSLGLAALAGRGDPDSRTPNPAGNTGGRMAGGLGGFKVVGMVAGALVHSQAFGYAMGVYGAGMSVYSHFISRGQEVVFPKNTAMEIGLGTRPSGEMPTVPSGAGTY